MKAAFQGKSLTIKGLQGVIKFQNDNISYESDEYSIHTFGFFLNMSECLKKYSCENVVELLCMIIHRGECLPLVLHGCYLIVFFNKKSNQLYVINDLLSKHSLYYYFEKNSKTLLFSDSFFSTLELVKEYKFPYSIDSLGVKMMLWHRMFYDELTYVREIKFLRPFDYIEFINDDVRLRTIEKPGMVDVSMNEAAGEINRLFNKAVKLQYQKNEENGFPQITTLSGGMDSRTTFLYGLENGYKEQTCYCYGESTSADYQYAHQLASKNNCDFYFHPIDGGNHLLKRENMCMANEGQMVYSGPSGVYDSLNFYNTAQWGIVHTGLGGGEIMGDMRVADNPTKSEQIIESLKYKLGKGKKDRSWESLVRSLRCTEEDRIRIENFKQHYRDFNEFQSLNDMRRCLNAQKMAQSFGVEYVSPFLYEEFFCYMLRIPFSLTKDRKLYLYWQRNYNPRQFETPSTFQLGCRPENKVGYFAKRFYKYVMNRMGRKTGYDMIPVELWLKVNPKIKQTQDTWYETEMKKLEHILDPSLTQFLTDVWNKGAASRQNILTATWTLSRIYD